MKAAALTVGMTLFSAVTLAAGEAAHKHSDSPDPKKPEINSSVPESSKVPPVPVPGTTPAKTFTPEPDTTLLNGKDHEFLMTSLENGRVLVWLGTVAKENARTELVRAFGEGLQRSQAEENERLRMLAKTKGLKIQADQSPAQRPKLASELPELEGPTLDKALVAHIIKAAQTAVTVYEQGQRSEDADIKTFCEQMVPRAKGTLARALEVARSQPVSKEESKMGR